MATYNLPRLPAGTKIVYPDGSSSMEFATFWDQFARVIEKIVDDLTLVDTDLTQAIIDIQAAQADADQALIDAAAADAAAAAAQADADAAQNDAIQAIADALAAQQDATDALADALAAQGTANTAVTNAATAQTAATTANRDASIATSYVYPGECLIGTDAGTDATINISAHTRRYSDGGVTTVAVNSGSVTGLSFNTEYFVYYDQTSRAGGAVTYFATTNPNVAAPGKAAGRHFVGTITTPANGAADTVGGFGMPSSGGEVTRAKIGGTG